MSDSAIREKRLGRFLERLAERVLICDGAVGTMLYNKGVYINQNFEALNLSKPNLVQEVHAEYVKAGADIIETNTFGANRLKLAPAGLADKVAAINREGARLARAAAGDSAFVAGSIGPSGESRWRGTPIERERLAEVFREQAVALAEGGVDLFIIETFGDLDELLVAIEAVRAAGDLPIIAQARFANAERTDLGFTIEEVAQALDRAPVEVVGLNCGVGPAVALDLLARFRSLTKKPISVQPNAGLPQDIDNRSIYLSTPDYMAVYAGRMIQKGAAIVGGCCGTTPAHIREIRAQAKALQPASTIQVALLDEVKAGTVARPAPATTPSRFAAKLRAGRFAVSVEIDPPVGSDPQATLESVRALSGSRVDAINIADGPRAMARMSPLPMALRIRDEIGLEPIIHYCCRDRNILAMQADLLGANVLGICNILAVTGDPPRLGNYPQATAVFDVDSIGLVRLIRKLNAGTDLGGNPIGPPTAFFAGVGANPGAIDLDKEVFRLEQKVAAGAEFVLTQPVYDVRLFERFIGRTKHTQVPVLVGILPLVSSRNAEFLHREIPGMEIPDAIRERMRKVGSGPAARAEGLAIAREALRECAPMCQGVYVMPPFNRASLALEVLEVLG
jgi:homocysteine S-methyltransferase